MVRRPGCRRPDRQCAARFSEPRFEVTEESGSSMGERFCFTPTLGMFRAATGPNGDILVNGGNACAR